MMNVIAGLAKISPPDAEILLGTAMFGVRLNALRKIARTIDPNSKVKASIDEFCDSANRMIGKRNHLAHGIWGLYTDDEGIPPEPACYYPDNKKGLILSSDLPDILEGCRNLTELISSIYNLMANIPYQDKEQIIHFGYGSPEGFRDAPQGAIYMDISKLGHSKS
ncbi:hypothetical protein [Brucella pseudogrignonensis]|uniref:hypothetical protein n=1 Tax=Brucella pseudogrignonensis TaxID=419475 RepID=UPI003ED0CD6C